MFTPKVKTKLILPIMASVAIVYRKDKMNKKGIAPVHLRIIIDRKINYLSTGEMIPEKFWI